MPTEYEGEKLTPYPMAILKEPLACADGPSAVHAVAAAEYEPTASPPVVDVTDAPGPIATAGATELAAVVAPEPMATEADGPQVPRIATEEEPEPASEFAPRATPL